MPEDGKDFLKAGVIIIVLAMSLVFGSKASQTWVIRFMVFVFGTIGIVYLIRKPEIGVILLVPISFLFRWDINTGSKIYINFTFFLVIVLIGIWIFISIASHSPVFPFSNSIDKFSLLFITAVSISLVGGNIQWVINARNQAGIPSQVLGWLLYILSICMMLYVQTHLKEIRWIKTLTWLFLTLGTIFIIKLLIPIDLIRNLRIFAPNSDGSMFWIWLVSLASGQALFNKDLKNSIRIGLGLLVVMTIVTSLSSTRLEWKSGWLPPIIALLTILSLRSWRIGLSITILTALVYSSFKTGIVSDILTTSEQYSMNSRMATLPIMIELIKANPVIGLGLANYSYYTSLYPIWGYYVSFNSHNNYVDIIAQTGFVGLFLFIGLMIVIIKHGWKLHKLESDGFSTGYINACLGGVVGTLTAGFLGDWFLPYLYNIGVPGFRSSIFAWIFIGGMLALGKIIENRGNNQAQL